MTERQKIEKLYEEEKKKNPAVTEDEVQELYRSKQKRKSILMSILLIAMGMFVILFSFTIQHSYVSVIFLIIGIAETVYAIFSMFHSGRERKPASDADTKKNVDLSYMTKRHVLSKKLLENGDFKLLETELTDKQSEFEFGSDRDPCLIFDYAGKYKYHFEQTVGLREYNKREIGDGCCLLLKYKDSFGRYELLDIFWQNETEISPELRKHFATDEEIAAVNKYASVDDIMADPTKYFKK